MNSRPTSHLLYLHGFRSSPQSAKARVLAGHMTRHHPAVCWWCPQLSPSPRETIEALLHGIAGWPRETMAVMGSSLGGFYATHIAAVTGCRAVLLNPAVHPARDLTRYIGDQSAWHDPTQHFYFRPEYIDELRALEVGLLSQPERCFTLIAKGDEVLDWREMVARYPGSHIELLENGDHALSDFETAHLGKVLDFLNLSLRPGKVA